MEQLKSCPFCGELVKMDTTLFPNGTMGTFFVCQNSSCHAETAFFGYDDEKLFERRSIEKWNRRINHG